MVHLYPDSHPFCLVDYMLLISQDVPFTNLKCTKELNISVHAEGACASANRGLLQHHGQKMLSCSKNLSNVLSFMVLQTLLLPSSITIVIMSRVKLY